ncbi:GntR family transcriptional regulator [Sporosarcina sp. G11-34]|uniref:GntR family transcriptional regulator n=1 Tax=Sporosarcina sp. G11-34 TaxID=2849605 RepID=UPI0022A93821|nr:GntR family transcriptional regulator [Sporosarcina sp. G11-34]MCZ2258599.1 GntR family transcriptional regulator [Sporosarcina sp. G11-34]
MKINPKIVQVPPLYLQVYDGIREEILTGRIEANGQINEVQLAKQLNVSRGPIREAVGKLEQEGLLIRKNKSLYVYKTSKEDLQEIYACRIALESLAVKLTTKNLSEDAIAELNEVFREKERLLKVQSVENISDRFTKECSKFHEIILRESGNERLYQQTNQLRNLTRFYRNSKLRIAEIRKNMYEQHLGIFEAMKAGKGEEAAILMKEHMESDLTFLLENF